MSLRDHAAAWCKCTKLVHLRGILPAPIVLGPLHGVPLHITDRINDATLPPTAGTRLWSTWTSRTSRASKPPWGFPVALFEAGTDFPVYLDTLVCPTTPLTARPIGQDQA